MEEKADYQLSASENDGIVEIVITGEITEHSFDRLRDEVITILREQKAKALLWDGRTVKAPHNIIDAYFRVSSIPLDVRKLPVAIVDLSENGNFESFYETTAANIGQSMKYFTDIETARTWLKSKL